jgi:hypothetical protein
MVCIQAIKAYVSDRAHGAVLQEPIFTHVVMKSPIFYRIKTSVTAFLTAYHWTILSQTNPLHKLTPCFLTINLDIALNAYWSPLSYCPSEVPYALLISPMHAKYQTHPPIMCVQNAYQLQ